jgi:hypothetical protein
MKYLTADGTEIASSDKCPVCHERAMHEDRFVKTPMFVLVQPGSKRLGPAGTLLWCACCESIVAYGESKAQ